MIAQPPLSSSLNSQSVNSAMTGSEAVLLASDTGGFSGYFPFSIVLRQALSLRCG